MAREERAALLAELEKLREGRLTISYVTSTRTNFEMQIADDVLPLFHEHLEAAVEKAKKGVDLFIHSNGGSGTVPWRIVSLIREYTKSFAVLVPHRAFSAATLIALGADEVVMHRMGCLGPIDPSVANQFNPANPQNPALPIPISVEDVTAYFRLVKDEVGITHEDELVQALVALTEKIHPLALSNVQRSHNQSRLMARKLLHTHMEAKQEHEIDTIIENLKSNLFFHGHPINRKEAKEDLDLKVEAAPIELERTMWQLYSEYDAVLKLREPFSALHELDLASTQSQRVPQAQTGSPVGAAVQAAASSTIKLRLDKIPGIYVESGLRADVFFTDLSLQRTSINTPVGPQDAIKQEVIWQRWEQEA
jgi:Serine dehydrogenase proteinase